MMRVLMLHNDYAQTGGEYYSVRAELDALRELGVDAELLTIANDEVIEAGGNGAIIKETITSRTSRDMLHKALSRMQPDIVHAQNLFPLMGGGVIDVLRAKNLPWVRTLRNYRLRCIAGTCFRDGNQCVLCESANKGLPGVRYRCYRGSRAGSIAAVGYALREARASSAFHPSGYILLSDAMRRILGPLLGNTQTYFKPNSVPGDPTLVPVTRSQRDDEFLFVGRFAPEKGIGRLIDEFATAPDLKLTLIGDGELSDRELDRVQGCSNISIVGRLDHEAVAKRMRRTLAVLVPSLWEEPFGRVAAESLAAGTPALVSATGGLPDIVSPILGDKLVVHPGQSWHEKARSIRAMTSTDYDTLANLCIERWRTEYEESVVGKRLFGIYQDVIERTTVRGIS